MPSFRSEIVLYFFSKTAIKLSHDMCESSIVEFAEFVIGGVVAPEQLSSSFLAMVFSCRLHFALLLENHTCKKINSFQLDFNFLCVCYDLHPSFWNRENSRQSLPQVDVRVVRVSKF